MAISQSNTIKVEKPLNADALIILEKDVSNAKSFSVQVFIEGATAPLNGVLQILASNVGGISKNYKVVRSIPINILSDNNYYEFFEGGDASVRFLGFNYVSGGAGAGTIKTITIYGKQ